MKMKPMIIWVGTKGKKETVFRKCPDKPKRMKYDNFMPFIEKTAFNMVKGELAEANKEIARLKGLVNG